MREGQPSPHEMGLKKPEGIEPVEAAQEQSETAIEEVSFEEEREKINWSLNRIRNEDLYELHRRFLGSLHILDRDPRTAKEKIINALVRPPEERSKELVDGLYRFLESAGADNGFVKVALRSIDNKFKKTIN